MFLTTKTARRLVTFWVLPGNILRFRGVFSVFSSTKLYKCRVRFFFFIFLTSYQISNLSNCPGGGPAAGHWPRVPRRPRHVQRRRQAQVLHLLHHLHRLHYLHRLHHHQVQLLARDARLPRDESLTAASSRAKHGALDTKGPKIRTGRLEGDTGR